LLRDRDDRLLTGDQFHLGGGRLDFLLVLTRLAHAHVERDLLDLGHLEPVLVTELLGHRLDDLIVILRPETRDVLVSHQSSPRTSRPRGPSCRPWFQNARGWA